MDKQEVNKKEETKQCDIHVVGRSKFKEICNYAYKNYKITEFENNSEIYKSTFTITDWDGVYKKKLKSKNSDITLKICMKIIDIYNS